MKYLFVVAHPDDEVLGCGGTIFNLSSKNDVKVVILSGNVTERKNRPKISSLIKEIYNANKLLGVKSIKLGNFPNIRFNVIPHIDLVKFIENEILDFKPDFVFTHHPNDLNNDHFHTSIATQAAIRLFQRNSSVKELKAFYFFETLSSTDWSLNQSFRSFEPNTFFKINNEGLNSKIKALEQYSMVMREFPHPRSVESIKALATIRGSQSGLFYAEAFQCVFSRINNEF